MPHSALCTLHSLHSLQPSSPWSSPGPVSSPPSCGAVPEGVDLLVGEEVDGAHRHLIRVRVRVRVRVNKVRDRVRVRVKVRVRAINFLGTR